MFVHLLIDQLSPVVVFAVVFVVVAVLLVVVVEFDPKNGTLYSNFDAGSNLNSLLRHMNTNRSN